MKNLWRIYVRVLGILYLLPFPLFLRSCSRILWWSFVKKSSGYINLKMKCKHIWIEWKITFPLRSIILKRWRYFWNKYHASSSVYAPKEKTVISLDIVLRNREVYFIYPKRWIIANKVHSPIKCGYNLCVNIYMKIKLFPRQCQFIKITWILNNIVLLKRIVITPL